MNLVTSLSDLQKPPDATLLNISIYFISSKTDFSTVVFNTNPPPPKKGKWPSYINKSIINGKKNALMEDEQTKQSVQINIQHFCWLLADNDHKY